MDEWQATAAICLGSLKAIIHWARERGDVTLLFGNHDLPYTGLEGFTRFHFTAREIIDDTRVLFADNSDIFKVVDHEGDWLFSHAGVTAEWGQRMLLFSNAALPIDTQATAAELASCINAAYADDIDRRQLEIVGKARGGYGQAGCLWADKGELLASPYPRINQAVGHTPIDSCFAEYTSDGYTLAFCDSFTNGDKTLVLLDTDTGQLTRFRNGEPSELHIDAYNIYTNKPNPNIIHKLRCKNCGDKLASYGSTPVMCQCGRLSLEAGNQYYNISCETDDYEIIGLLEDIRDMAGSLRHACESGRELSFKHIDLDLKRAEGKIAAYEELSEKLYSLAGRHTLHGSPPNLYEDTKATIADLRERGLNLRPQAHTYEEVANTWGQSEAWSTAANALENLLLHHLVIDETE